jgi:uncharacterized protein YjcR
MTVQDLIKQLQDIAKVNPYRQVKIQQDERETDELQTLTEVNVGPDGDVVLY